VRHLVAELPPITPQVTEYRVHRLALSEAARRRVAGARRILHGPEPHSEEAVAS
jgi:hypothetical protein